MQESHKSLGRSKDEPYITNLKVQAQGPRAGPGPGAGAASNSDEDLANVTTGLMREH